MTKEIFNFMNLVHMTTGGSWIFSELTNTVDSELVFVCFVGSKELAVIPNGPFILRSTKLYFSLTLYNYGFLQKFK